MLKRSSSTYPLLAILMLTCGAAFFFGSYLSEAQQPGRRGATQGWEYKLVPIDEVIDGGIVKEAQAEALGNLSFEEMAHNLPTALAGMNEGNVRDAQHKVIAALQQGFNKLGAEGWQFCDNMDRCLVFRRPKE